MRRDSALLQPEVPWRYGLLPKTVGNGVHNTARDVAIFVVHGIGDQQHAETSNAMRVGFERAVDAAKQQTACEAGSPYVHDGWWGNYDDFSASMPDVAQKLHSEECASHSRLFKARSLSGIRTLSWFFGVLLSMASPHRIGLRSIGKKISPVRYVTYVLMGLLTIIGMVILLIRKPVLMYTTINDVRLYCGPEGDTERGICENIDRRVAQQFLRLYGLDLALDDLPIEQQIHLENKPVIFEKVVWVCHSLGTVISYNTVTDILQLCQLAMEQASATNATDKERQRGANAEKVLKGFHRFYTMGSPLQKASFLFEECLREKHSAKKVLQDFLHKRKEWGFSVDSWWTNYYMIMDTISGRLLDKIRFAGFVRNAHPARLGLPMVAHTGYWKDVLVTTPILSRILGPTIFTYEAHKPMPLSQTPHKNIVYNNEWSERITVVIRFFAYVVMLATVVLIPLYWGKVWGFICLLIEKLSFLW